MTAKSDEYQPVHSTACEIRMSNGTFGSPAHPSSDDWFVFFRYRSFCSGLLIAVALSTDLAATWRRWPPKHAFR